MKGSDSGVHNSGTRSEAAGVPRRRTSMSPTMPPAMVPIMPPMPTEGPITSPTCASGTPCDRSRKAGPQAASTDVIMAVRPKPTINAGTPVSARTRRQAATIPAR